jgi:hypothetical protein
MDEVKINISDACGFSNALGILEGVAPYLYKRYGLGQLRNSIDQAIRTSNNNN